MPEGHTLFRLATSLRDAFAGEVVAVSSPQGRFAESAALLDGTRLVDATSYGKHLFVEFDESRLVHVHLGLYGKFPIFRGPAPEPVGQVRMRLVGGSSYADLRGATACELITGEQRGAVLDRLGPDPLDPTADPDRAWHRIHRSRVPIGGLLMDQSVLAGVGNVYRAEVLFRHRMHPLRPGRSLRVGQWRSMWDDLVDLDGRRCAHRSHRDAAAGGPGPGRRGPRGRVRPQLRLPADGGALPGLRRQGQDGGAPGAQPLLVPALSARFPLKSPKIDESDCPSAVSSVSSAPPSHAHHGRSSCSCALRSPWRGWRLRWRREWSVSDMPALWLLTVLALFCLVLGLVFPLVIPSTAMLVPIVISGLFLGPRYLPWFIVFCCGCFCILLFEQDVVSYLAIGRAIVVFFVALLMMVTSFRRTRLGVSGPRGESMFVDLRDRISKQGDLPDLPPQWYAESVMRSAGGTSFAGDFVVAQRTTGPCDATAPVGIGDHLDLVVVDVSGKGVEAGSRSLFLSGALNGIVSALPGERFLPAANRYLIGQQWPEGFATAVHLHLDLTDGSFELRKAGHPPAVWLHAGSGRWTVMNSDGPALGLLDDAEFEPRRGRLEPGDALMLFTDGLVETARRDIARGIDKLAGLGERLFQLGFDGGAQVVLDSMEQTNDDRALVLVHRRAP